MYLDCFLNMGNSNSLPEIPGGGTDGYHVLRVQVSFFYFKCRFQCITDFDKLFKAIYFLSLTHKNQFLTYLP